MIINRGTAIIKGNTVEFIFNMKVKVSNLRGETFGHVPTNYVFKKHSVMHLTRGV